MGKASVKFGTPGNRHTGLLLQDDYNVRDKYETWFFHLMCLNAVVYYTQVHTDNLMPQNLHILAEGLAKKFRPAFLASVKQVCQHKGDWLGVLSSAERASMVLLDFEIVVKKMADTISAMSRERAGMQAVIYSFANNSGSFLGRDWIATMHVMPFCLRSFDLS